MLARLEIILALLGAVAGLALLAQKVKVPYGILLVTGGLFLGWIPGIPPVRLSPELFLLVLLPPLLYPEAVLLPWRDFRAKFRPIVLLALGLVLCTMVGVGWIGHWLIPQMPLAPAFVLGAIVSPTDPVATTAIAHRMQVPRRIVRVLKGESLVNDATGSAWSCPR
ncbi:MAG TPA: cation:proton antiporter [Candidatus Sulfotelmatobacter sp.]|nr:cation:proton antiporter [Candidatus Sulfotelmatobacter sp.]